MSGYLVYFEEAKEKKYCQALGQGMNSWTYRRDEAKVFGSNVVIAGCKTEKVDTVDCYSIRGQTLIKELKQKEFNNETSKTSAKETEVQRLEAEIIALQALKTQVEGLD